MVSTATMDEIIRKVGDLKVLPFVAQRVLETLGNENCSVDDLGSIIEKDQAISARVLKVANSALYGLRQNVTSVQQALLVLGFKTIRNLVLSVSTKSLYKDFGMTEQIIWDHSVGAAIASKMIAGDIGKDVEDFAFIGGLMHDLGKVVMNNETKDAFTEVMMRVYNEQVSSLDAEEEIYGYNHTEIGSRIVEKWGFSPLLVQILRHHHLAANELTDFSDSLTAKSIACVHLADHFCRRLGIGYRHPDDSLVLQTLPSALFLSIEADRISELGENISETYEREKSVFQ